MTQITGRVLSRDEVRGILPAGTVVGGCEVLGLIGRGGMGAVYRGRHRTLERLVAVKVLDPLTREDRAELVALFLREARSTAKLEHHNIVTVYNAGQEGHHLFIEMQLVDGAPLCKLLSRGPSAKDGAARPLPLYEATRHIEQVAHALQHAHQRGLIHRDIKPENILLTPDGVIKLVDFGIAQPVTLESSTEIPSTVLGTPSYMAPEQCQGLPLDGRADLYALGVTYFQLVTGELPYQGNSSFDLLRQHVESPIPLARDRNPEVPAAISDLIRRLMAKNPEERPQSAGELIGELRRLEQLLLGETPEGEAAEPAAGATTGAEAQAQDRRKVSGAATPSKWKSLLSLGLLWVAICGGVLLLQRSDLGERFELFTFDQRQIRRPAQPASDGVRLLLIDDDTAEQIGLAFDRDVLVNVIDGLVQAGARVIALDLLVSDHGPGAGDVNLAAATAEAKRLVHAIYLFQEEKSAGRVVAVTEVTPDETEAARLKEQDQQLDRLSLTVAQAAPLPEADRATLPIPAILKATQAAGNVGLQVDADGVVRRVPLLVRYGERVFPALALMAFALSQGASPKDIHWEPGRVIVSPPQGKRQILPVDRQGALTLNVRGTLTERPHHSVRWLLENLEDPEGRERIRQAYRDKIVLLGIISSGHTDIQPMPGMPAASLVLAHAMAIETMLAGDHVRAVGSGLPEAVMLGLAALGLILASRLRWGWTAVLLAGLLLLYGSTVFLLFRTTNLLLPVGGPMLALIGATLVGGLRRYRLEQLQRRRLEDALTRYLPSRVARQVLADPKGVRLGGLRKELTLLAVEVHGFDAITEQLEPEEVGQLLQPLFAEVAAVIFRHGGTLDRFSGEGVRAFFGDPVPQSDHALRAVRAALELRTAVRQTIVGWGQAGYRRPSFGIGVRTGYVTVGNIGVAQRMEYTVLGRNVQLTEEAARSARNQVLVASRTQTLTSGHIVYEVHRRQDGPDLTVELFEACSLK